MSLACTPISYRDMLNFLTAHLDSAPVSVSELGGLSVAFVPGTYDTVTDEGLYEFRLAGRVVRRRLKGTTFNTPSEMAAELKQVAVDLIHVLGTLPEVGGKDFSEEPVSLGEVRSAKHNDGKLRSVRELLVEVLRRMDSGEREFQNLTAAVLVFKRREGEDTFTRYDAGGPEYDSVNAMGMMLRVAINMELD